MLAMKLKVYILIIISLLLLTSETNASTFYAGGEISWECLPNGRYRFKMRLYRECYTQNGQSSANYSQTQTLQTTVSGISSITLTRLPAYPKDMSPQCNSNPSYTHLSCTGMPSGAAGMGAIQEHVYTSDATYPNGVQLNGVPPANGWTFSWSNCCRLPSLNIVNASSQTWCLMAKMYSFNNQDANPCYDSSPEFGELPPAVIPTGYPFQFNYLAIDNEMDSLAYEWGQPMTTPTTVLTSYAAGYSYNSPFPGTTHNPNNVAANIDPHSGVISFTSFTPGYFITNVKVTAYKNGVKVAEIWREVMIALVTVMQNTPPLVSAPFINPVSGLYTNFSKTVFAGDTVNFIISGTDFGFLPNQQPQTVSLNVTSPHFGANYSSSTMGCLKPPCATLNPPPPVSAPFAAQSTFYWQTDVAHLGSDTSVGSVAKTYNFLIKVSDDFCPVPAVTYRTIAITVLPRPAPPSPRITCLKVQPTAM
jgi:hypothetical protein